MLSNHLGQELFLKGVSNYLKKHAYGNARTNDLWAALSEASGTDVGTFMDPWIRKIGFPVITVAEEPGQVSLRQTRFLTTGDVKAEEDETTWWVPLALKTGSQNKTSSLNLTAKEETLRSIDDRFYKLNADQTGFYRTNYPPARLTRLGQAQDLLSVEDKIGLLGDATALAVAGDGTTAGLLAFVEGFKDEKSYLVWSQISSSLSKVRSVFSSSKEVSDGLKKYQLKLVSPAAESIGWEFGENEDYLTGQLRKLLIAMAGGAGHEGIIAEAKKRFASWKSGDENAIHQNLRSVIFNVNVAQGGEAEFQAVKDEYIQTTSVDGKEICLAAMGRTKKHELATDLLDFVTSDSVPPQDAHGVASSLANNNESRIVFWEYTKSKWERVHARLSGSNVVMDRWIKIGLAHYSDFGIEEDIQKFFKDKETKAYERSLVIVSDTIKGNAKYKQRDEQLVLEWLKAHGYA
jgi:aminopeptidase N